MRIKIQAPLKYAEQLKQRLQRYITSIESEDAEGNFKAVMFRDTRY
jgi:hypothetical protein